MQSPFSVLVIICRIILNHKEHKELRDFKNIAIYFAPLVFFAVKVTTNIQEGDNLNIIRIEM